MVEDDIPLSVLTTANLTSFYRKNWYKGATISTSVSGDKFVLDWPWENFGILTTWMILGYIIGGTYAFIPQKKQGTGLESVKSLY